MNIDQIISYGDRAELKKWLNLATNREITSNWVKIAASNVQDFQELIMNEMKNRKILK